jgi:hypothetical protein
MQTVATTWDIRVVSAMNAASVVAYIPRWQSIEFSDQLSDYGTGKLVHDFADPFFAQFEIDNGFPLLTGPYALQIVRNGTAVFTFFIEDVQVARLPDAQTVTISGRGIGSALEWAIALPEGYSGQARVTAIDGSYPKLWDRDFVGYKWIVRVATTTNLTANYSNGTATTYPGSGAYLSSTTNANINTAGIDGITDLIVGDRILVKNQTDTAQNGIYTISDVGSASTVWRLTRTGDADAPNTLVLGNQAFICEGTTNGYKIYNLTGNGGMTLLTDVGTSAITFTNSVTGGINALAAFWLLFKEAQTGYEYTSASASFGTQVTTNGRGGPTYAVNWPLYLDSVIDANKGYLDSKGQIIQDAGTFSVPQGKHMGEVIKQVTEQTGLAWHFDASGSVSFVVAPFSRNGVVNTIPFGVDRTSGSVALLFTSPSLQESETKSSVTDRRTVTYGSDQRGIDKIVSTQKSTYGIRESWFENSAQDAAAISNFTSTAMRKIDGAKLSQTVKFPERTGQTAWVDFFVGDKILVESAVGLYSSLIVSAISASISPSNEQTIEVTFGAIFPDIASDLSLEGGFGSSNASTIAGFTGQTPNVNLPAPVSASVATTTVGMSNRVTVTWDNTGSKAAQYEIAVFRENTMLTGFALTRSGNLAVGTKTTHGLTNGLFVNVYPATGLSTNNGFASYNVPLLSTSSSVIYWANQGPDISASVSASVAQVLEYSTVIVDGSQNSATIENLSSPGSTYSYTVTAINELGLKSTKTIRSSFVSSNEPFQLVSSAVQSTTYVAGSTGWRIAADGSAEFNAGSFSIGGYDTSSFHVDVNGNIWSGSATLAGATFSVLSNGYMTSTAGTFSGSITASTIDIGGADTTSFHVDATGNFWSGGATFSTALFSVNSSGTMLAHSGDIGGFSMVGDSLFTGAGFLGFMYVGNLSAAGLTTGYYGSQLAGMVVAGAGTNYAYYTFDSAKFTNGAGQTAIYDAKGMQFTGDSNHYRLRLSGSSVCMDVENSGGTSTAYCYAAAPAPAPSPTPTPTPTPTPPTPTPTCTAGVIAYGACCPRTCGCREVTYQYSDCSTSTYYDGPSCPC